MLQIKEKLHYRRGYEWKDCSTCLEFVHDMKQIGISDEKLEEQPRCRIIGLQPGRMFRILPHYICDSHNPDPRFHRGVR
jgi:hypothetical protein